MDPFISIIMPCHNSEISVINAIESVLRQTIDNWELIIIDDFSTDRTVTIIERYSKRDKRIKTVRLTKNLGPSKARNIGIENSSGKYISFLDSDDTLAPNYFDCIKKTFSEFPADILWFQYNERRGGLITKVDNEIPKNVPLSNYEALEIIFKNLPGSYVVWNKVFRKGFITDHNICFNEKRLRGEDMEFVLNTLQKAKTIICIESYLYYYTVLNSSSISKTYRTSDVTNMINTIELFRKIEKEFNISAPKGYYAKHLKSILEQIYIYSNLDQKIAKKMIQKIKQSYYYKFAFNDSKKGQLSLTYRTLAYLIKYSPSLAILFCRIK